jgi:hypothetical protein
MDYIGTSNHFGESGRGCSCSQAPPVFLLGRLTVPGRGITGGEVRAPYEVQTIPFSLSESAEESTIFGDTALLWYLPSSDKYTYIRTDYGECH